MPAPRLSLIASIVTLSLISATVPLAAADLAVQPGVRHAAAGPTCGPCGCLRVAYVYHRDVQSTYGTDFDPRNYDQTEPHYYLGGLHRYPRYFVDGVAVPPFSPDCR
jgi:hypothetical protein